MAERIVALVDPDPRMRAATRERMVQVGWRDALAGVREFFDYRELYAKMGDALDAVFIATPKHARVLCGHPREPPRQHGLRLLRAACRDAAPRERGRPRREGGRPEMGRSFHHQQPRRERLPLGPLPPGLGTRLKEPPRGRNDGKRGSSKHRDKGCPDV